MPTPIGSKFNGYSADGRRLYHFGGDSPSPDKNIGKAALQNAATGERYMDMAEEAYADQKKLTEEFSPLFRKMIEQSNADAATSRERADAQWDSYSKNFAPLEAKMAQQAAEFDTPERRAAAAREASGTVADKFALSRDMQRQAAFSQGIQPGLGQTAMDNASRIAEAKASAGAANEAERGVETQGLALVDNAARFGRNMPSTGIQAAALAGQQTGAAQGQVGALQGLVAAPGQTAAPLMQGSVNANNSAGQLLLGQFNAQMQGHAASQAATADLIGGVAGAAGMYFGSSEKVKDVGGEVDGRAASEAVERSPSKAWSYKPGLGDGSTKPRVGPTAEALRDSAGPAVSDGRQVDAIGMLGLHHAAIGDQGKRLKQVEAALGLTDKGVA